MNYKRKNYLNVFYVVLLIVCILIIEDLYTRKKFRDYYNDYPELDIKDTINAEIEFILPTPGFARYFGYCVSFKLNDGRKFSTTGCDVLNEHKGIGSILRVNDRIFKRKNSDTIFVMKDTYIKDTTYTIISGKLFDNKYGN